MLQVLNPISIDEKAVLGGIYTRPADATARLAYADMLDEADEPVLAEYVRLSQPATLDGEQAARLAAICTEAEQKLVARLLPGYKANPNETILFERGIPSWIECTEYDPPITDSPLFRVPLGVILPNGLGSPVDMSGLEYVRVHTLSQDEPGIQHIPLSETGSLAFSRLMPPATSSEQFKDACRNILPYLDAHGGISFGGTMGLMIQATQNEPNPRLLTNFIVFLSSQGENPGVEPLALSNPEFGAFVARLTQITKEPLSSIGDERIQRAFASLKECIQNEDVPAELTKCLVGTLSCMSWDTLVNAVEGDPVADQLLTLATTLSDDSVQVTGMKLRELHDSLRTLASKFGDWQELLEANRGAGSYQALVSFCDALNPHFAGAEREIIAGNSSATSGADTCQLLRSHVAEILSRNPNETRVAVMTELTSFMAELSSEGFDSRSSAAALKLVGQVVDKLGTYPDADSVRAVCGDVTAAAVGTLNIDTEAEVDTAAWFALNAAVFSHCEICESDHERKALLENATAVFERFYSSASAGDVTTVVRRVETLDRTFSCPHEAVEYLETLNP